MKIVVRVKPQKKNLKIIKLAPNLFGVDCYEVHLTKMPIAGACNRELIELLSNYFNISKNSIKITCGSASREKIVEID